VILWYVGGATFLVWNVFQSSGLDFRYVAAGALVPLVVDLPLGRQAYGHTLALSVAVLAAVVLATSGRGRRLARRRVIGLPIGMFSGLVLSGVWSHQRVFWWPAFGVELPHVALVASWPWAAVEELLGLAAVVWAWRRFGLADPSRRRVLLRTGRLAVVPT